jgi:type II secretory pathway pseudopilin PulG
LNSVRVSTLLLHLCISFSFVFPRTLPACTGSLDHQELVIGLKELKHPKPTLSTVMKMLAEVNLEKNDLISFDEFVIMWKNRQVSGGMLRSVQLAKAMGIIADPAVVHALLAVMASVIAEAQAKAKVRAARTNAGRASAQAALQQQEQQQTGEVPPSAVTVEQMQLPWEGPPPGVSELQGNRLLRELGGPYDPLLPLTGCMAYHARRLMMAAEEQEEKAAAAAKSGKTSGKSTPKTPSGGGSKTPKNGGSSGNEMKDSSEAQRKREIKDRLQEEALQGVKSEAPEASNSRYPTRGSGGVIAHCLPKSFFKSHGEWRNSSLTFDPRTRVLSCRATPYGIDRAAAAQALTLAQTSLKASALASPAGSALDGSVPPPPSPPLVPPNGTGPDLPPLLWARTVGEEEPAEALEDPVSTIHGYFYVMFSTAPESLNEATGDEATGVAAKARGILVAAPSEAVRRLWVDTLNGHVDTPVGGLYSPLASPLHEVGSSGGSGNGGEAGMRAVAEGSSSSGGAPVAGEGLEDESIAPASAVASVRGVDDGNGDDDIDEKEEDNNHVDDKSVGEEDEESGDREGAFGAFDLLEGGLGGLLSPAQEALYRDLESAEAVRDQGLVGAGQPPGKSRSNRGIGREERI